MRVYVLASALASGLLAGSVLPASAITAGPLPLAETNPAITLVSGGCGPAFHRTPWGFCRPNFYRPYAVYRPYGWGWHHRWHHWHHW